MPVTTIRKWTADVPRSGGEPWEFRNAPVGEVETTAEMYRHAVRSGQAELWPSTAQARWFARIRTLFPAWDTRFAYDLARYAAAVKEPEQRQIARALMLWAGDPAPDDTVLARAREEASIAGFTRAEAAAAAVAKAYRATVKTESRSTWQVPRGGTGCHSSPRGPVRTGARALQRR